MALPAIASADTCTEFTKSPGQRFGQIGGDVNSTINLAADGTNVTDVDVRVNIVHFYDDDVDIYLNHGGVQKTLISHAGNGTHNFTDTVLDDEASTLITNYPTAQGPVTGSYKPVQGLSSFDSQSSSGAWTLVAHDNFRTSGRRDPVQLGLRLDDLRRLSD